MAHLQREAVASRVLVEVSQVHVVYHWLVEAREVHLLREFGCQGRLASSWDRKDGVRIILLV